MLTKVDNEREERLLADEMNVKKDTSSIHSCVINV